MFHNYVFDYFKRPRKMHTHFNYGSVFGPAIADGLVLFYDGFPKSVFIWRCFFYFWQLFCWIAGLQQHNQDTNNQPIYYV